MRTRFCLIVVVSLIGAMAALPGYCSVPDLNAQTGLGPTFGAMKSPLVQSYDIARGSLVNSELLGLIHDRNLRAVDWTALHETNRVEPARMILAHDDRDEGDDEEADEGDDENGGDEEEEGGWNRTWDAPKLG